VAINAEQGSPTLEMVGKLAGVSRATVSRVVNGSDRVAPEVVTAVNAAIAQLNYVPNRAARSLAGRRTNALALVMPEQTARVFADPR
jgi:DNA-binding LacI/PurR family transcriptional regulator